MGKHPLGWIGYKNGMEENVLLNFVSEVNENDAQHLLPFVFPSIIFGQAQELFRIRKSIQKTSIDFNWPRWTLYAIEMLQTFNLSDAIEDEEIAFEFWFY